MVRMNPEERRELIMQEAMRLALELGYDRVTREMLSENLKCSAGLVSYYIGTVGQIQHAIIRRAINLGVPAVIAQAVVKNHPLVQPPHLSDALRQKTLKFLEGELKCQ